MKTLDLLKPLNTATKSLKNYAKRTRLRVPGFQYEDTVRFNGLPRLNIARGSTVTLGYNVVLNSKWQSNDISCTTPTTLITTVSTAKISIGADTGISSSIISARQSISIGARVLVGSGCLITDSDQHPVELADVSDRRYGDVRVEDTSPIVIGNDVFIGARSIILKGVTIGDGCVVGAGSTVSRDLPPMTICAGNPCKVIRHMTPPDTEEK